MKVYICCIIFRSEGPAQVFCIMLRYLRRILENVPKEKWKYYTLCYDNMCNVDGLKCAKDPLPIFDPPFDTMWTEINKIVDKLHLSNHVRKSCKSKYNPEIIADPESDRKIADELNTVVAEQTFAWLGKFKKIVSSMPKSRHMFTLHRLLVRRNLYTAWCRRNRRHPVLPKALPAYIRSDNEDLAD